MAETSLNSDFTFTFNPSEKEKEREREREKEKEKEEGQVVKAEESKLRPRPSLKKILNIEIDSKYKELILTLPKEERWPDPLRKYQGFWQWQTTLPGVLAMQEAFNPRPSDVIVASFPKSGTTWLKAITFTIVHRDKYTFSSHPLLKLNPNDCVPFVEPHYALRDEQYLETLPSPRVLGFHVAYSLLPESIKTSECRIIYICREPKDVIVSAWHMFKNFKWLKQPFPFAQAFELFCEGRMPCGPIWDHMLEYYTISLHNPGKILFLKYEDLMSDPIDNVARLANFIGCPFSEEEIRNGLVEEIVKFCSFNRLNDLDVNNDATNHHFFKKAAVGDWQNHMTTEMAAKLDKITKEKLRDCSFIY